MKLTVWVLRGFRSNSSNGIPEFNLMRHAQRDSHVYLTPEPADNTAVEIRVIPARAVSVDEAHPKKFADHLVHPLFPRAPGLLNFRGTSARVFDGL